MMNQLLAHLWGDFVLQNHPMAMRKRSSHKWAAIHAAFYSLPFLALMASPFPEFSLPRSIPALAVITITHFFIDRYGIAGYWIRFWGNGTSGYFTGPLDEPVPPFLVTMLAIIVDNTFHLTINCLSIAFL